MSTLATDPAFVAQPVQAGGSYVDSGGVSRDFTLNLVYPTNPDTTPRVPLTKREYFALMILTGKIGSPVYESVSNEDLTYQSVTQADVLIATLNNIPIP